MQKTIPAPLVGAPSRLAGWVKNPAAEGGKVYLNADQMAIYLANLVQAKKA